jgi:4-azaleucine resistance transporter AzlC
VQFRRFDSDIFILKKERPGIQITLRQGLEAGWPICLGYLPIGLAFGVLAQKAGLGPFEIGLMSLFVFAGSAQFISVSMLSSEATILSIVLTTFIVNLRHLLMSSALAVYLGRSKRRVLALFAYGVTDESFSVNIDRFKKGNWDLNRACVVNHAANITWIISTSLGGYAGQFIPQRAFGIDYALTAMFICLLVFQLKERRHIMTALVAGISSVIIALIVPGNSHIILAAILAATIGVVFRKVRSR